MVLQEAWAKIIFIRFTGIENDGPLHLFKDTALMRSKVGLGFLFLRQQDGWYGEWTHSLRNSAASCVSSLLLSFTASSVGIPCHWFEWDHVSVQKNFYLRIPVSAHNSKFFAACPWHLRCLLDIQLLSYPCGMDSGDGLWRRLRNESWIKKYLKLRYFLSKQKIYLHYFHP